MVASNEIVWDGAGGILFIFYFILGGGGVVFSPS